MQFDFFSAPAKPETDRLQLRDYQQQAREAVRAQHALHRATLVVLPTGAGKSRLGAALCTDFAPGSTLLLGPSIVLCDQLHNEMRRSGLSSSIERADQKATRSPMPTCVVGSVATLRGERLRSWPRDAFAHILVDEAHRSTSEMYSEILAHFECAKVTGLTATPDRADGVALGNVFGSTAFEMSMMDAIERKILCRMEFRTVATDWDPKRLKEVAGEVDPGSVARELVRSGVLHQAAAALSELGEHERTIAFLPTVAAAKAMSVELAARGVPCTHVDGTTPPAQREAIYRAFREGRVKVVTNCNVLSEGFDDPGVTCIAILSPTKSRSRLAQCIGRATRNHPGKERGLVLDFVPGRMKKGRLAAPADALAGKMLPDNVYDQLPESGDIAEAILTAEARCAENDRLREAKEAARLADLEKRAALNAARSLVKQQKASYSVSQHEAHDVLARAYAAIGGGELTPEDEDARRKRANVCSIKQAAVLGRYGFRADLPRHLAGELMTKIIAAKWKCPPQLRADPKYA